MKIKNKADALKYLFEYTVHMHDDNDKHYLDATNKLTNAENLIFDDYNKMIKEDPEQLLMHISFNDTRGFQKFVGEKINTLKTLIEDSKDSTVISFKEDLSIKLLNLFDDFKSNKIEDILIDSNNEISNEDVITLEK